MRFDLTITLGNLIQIALIVLSAVALYVKLRAELVEMKTKVELMFRWWQTEIERRKS